VSGWSDLVILSIRNESVRPITVETTASRARCEAVPLGRRQTIGPKRLVTLFSRPRLTIPRITSEPRALDRETAVLLVSLSYWSADQLVTQPTPQQWSAASVLRHLLGVERTTMEAFTPISRILQPSAPSTAAARGYPRRHAHGSLIPQQT
jgi:hypothetical protein